MTSKPAAPLDMVFAGRHEVVVVNGRQDFVVSGESTWLAGSFADRVTPSQVTAANAAELFGAFTLLRHDSAAHTLTVLTDRFGHGPLFMAEGDGEDAGRLLLGTDFAAVARRCNAANHPDSGAMSDILAFNVPFDQRTPSARITAPGGARALVIDLDTLAVQNQPTWNPSALLARATLSFDSVKDQLVDLFLDGVAMATAAHDRVAVTLSGGADSRCLLAASLQVGKPTAVYSTGVPGSRALAYAHGMAKLCGVQENPHPLDDGFLARLPTLMHESNQLMQGMSFSSELEAMWLREHVAPKGVLLHGAFAELYKIGKMHNFPYEGAITSLKGAAVSEYLWQSFAGRYALRSQGLAPSHRQALGEQARSHLADKVTRHQTSLDTAGVLQMIYIEEFLGKVAKASRHMWQQRIPAAFPFAYPPLVDLILRVRTPDKIANHFVAHLLKRTNTTLAHFPDSNTGVRIGASRLRRELVHVMDFATQRLFRPKARADHQDFADWLQRMQPGLEPLFDSLQTSTAGFDMAHVRQLIQRCRAGEDLASRTLQFLWAWGLLRTEGSMATATHEA